jgi:uncharacterized protein (DUF1778 family)
MPVKEARIDLRVSEELKKESEWAAGCEGQSLTRFVEEALRRRIREIREERERTILSERDREVFLAILDNEEPRDALRRSARKYRALVASGKLRVGNRAVQKRPRR